jgi:hypothetical protein
LDFWFENKPSGNPDAVSQLQELQESFFTNVALPFASGKHVGWHQSCQIAYFKNKDPNSGIYRGDLQ